MKWNAYFFSVLIGLSSFAFADTPAGPVSTPATQPTRVAAPADLLGRLQEELQVVNSVEADFVQEVRIAKLPDHPVKIVGHFALEKPDRAIWIVYTPLPYVVRVKGEEISSWDKDTGNVQVIRLTGDPTYKAVTEQMNAWFSGNYKALEQNFEVTVASESPLTIGFAPKEGSMIAKMLKQIDVTFGKDHKYIETMVVHQTAGSVLTLRYSNVKLNEPVKKQTWKVPPDNR